jgi:hypothetical protein
MKGVKKYSFYLPKNWEEQAKFIEPSCSINIRGILRVLYELTKEDDSKQLKLVYYLSRVGKGLEDEKNTIKFLKKCIDEYLSESEMSGGNEVENS